MPIFEYRHHAPPSRRHVFTRHLPGYTMADWSLTPPYAHVLGPGLWRRGLAAPALLHSHYVTARLPRRTYATALAQEVSDPLRIGIEDAACDWPEMTSVSMKKCIVDIRGLLEHEANVLKVDANSNVDSTGKTSLESLSLSEPTRRGGLSEFCRCNSSRIKTESVVHVNCSKQIPQR